jgi:ankyrin repeat protein
VHGDFSRALADQENHTKETPLHWAVLKNNYTIVKKLIAEHRTLAEAKPLIENQDEDEESQDDERNLYTGILDIENHNQQTPFFVAVIKGFLDVAELLSSDKMSSAEARDIVSIIPL